MNIAELRIGNKVLINGKVITMDSRIFHAVIHGFEGYEPEPIKLEWHHLHNALFKIPYQINLTGPVHKYGGGLYFFWSWDTEENHPITYLHELQNWYYLLSKGQELETKQP